jgi:hypothetical protein
MILKSIFAASVCGALLASSALARADEYHPGEYLGLDLSSALLSPKPLGPPAEFARVPVQAMTDRGSEAARPGVEPNAGARIGTPRIRVAHRGAGAQARLAAKAEPKSASRKAAMANVTGVKRGRATASLMARHRGNPLDAQALDTRVQVWPCKSGGICNWKR